MSGQVPAEAKKERSWRLRALSSEKREAFHSRHLGREVEVYLEEGGRRTGQPPQGLTGNYIRVFLPEASDVTSGSFVAARAVALVRDGLAGVPIRREAA